MEESFQNRFLLLRSLYDGIRTGSGVLLASPAPFLGILHGASNVRGHRTTVRFKGQ